MKTHAEIGFNLLNHSTRPVLKAASMIAYHHHEKWNGSGYPQQLSGEEIHIYGRITAVADVFDALGSARVYKKAWPLEEILALLQEQRGINFDPSLVDLLLENLPMFLKIRQNHPN
jgi:putative two-component system response regulator